MNTYSLESFITFCDEMQIAEESARSINKIYKKLLKDIEVINKELKNEDDLHKIIILCKKKKDLTQQVKSQIQKENENGFGDIVLYLKNMILPAIFAALTAMVATDKKNKLGLNKSDKGLAIGSFSAIAVATGIGSISDMKKIKLTKSNTLKIIDDQIDKIDEAIKFYEYAIKNGYSTRNEISSNGKEMSTYELQSAMNTKNFMSQIISKFNIKPVNEKTNIKKDTEFMEKDVLVFMKKYVSTPEFKKKYKRYLHLIDIESSDYAVPFSISITDCQNGVDDDIVDEWEKSHPDEDYYKSQYKIDTEWYDELMDVCEKYINFRFKAWKGYVWNSVNTGDGDEGTIYVEK